MNSRQAINLLKGLEQSLDDYCELNDEGKAAFRMAITALELFGNSEQLPSAQPEIRTQMSSANCISRQAAIDAISSMFAPIPSQKDMVEDCLEIIENLPSAQPEQQHGRVFKGIVVKYPEYCIYPEYKGKPYFSIKYTENGQEFIGYSTYKLEVLSEYLKEYFMPSEQPEIIRCKDCKYYLEGSDGLKYCYKHDDDILWFDDDFCSRAERRTD